jgi:hypothetical protein
MGHSPEYCRTMQLLRRIYGPVRPDAKSIKDLLRNPKQITHEHVTEYFPWRRFYFLPKVDGVRCLLLHTPE